MGLDQRFVVEINNAENIDQQYRKFYTLHDAIVKIKPDFKGEDIGLIKLNKQEIMMVYHILKQELKEELSHLDSEKGYELIDTLDRTREISSFLLFLHLDLGWILNQDGIEFIYTFDR